MRFLSGRALRQKLRTSYVETRQMHLDSARCDSRLINDICCQVEPFDKSSGQATSRPGKCILTPLDVTVALINDICCQVEPFDKSSGQATSRPGKHLDSARCDRRLNK